MTFIIHRWLDRRVHHHPHFAAAGFHDHTLPRRPRLAARWVRGADGKLACHWHQISSD